MQDLLIGENFEMQIANGDLVTGISDQQHQQLLLLCNKGSFKENPASCVGLMNFLEAEDPAEMIREIKLQFSADGMDVKKAEITNGKLNVEAYY